MEALLHGDDDDVFTKLLDAGVERGSAAIVSEISTRSLPGEEFSIRRGTEYSWVTENDQEFEPPTLIPTGWKKVLLGTSLKGDYPTEQYLEDTRKPVLGDPFAAAPADADYLVGKERPLALPWDTEIRQERLIKVRWPLVWPEAVTPVVNWHVQDDFLTQRLAGRARLRPGRSTILSIMRPASDLEQKSAKAEVDVMVVQTRAAAPPKSGSKEALPPPTSRVVVIGYGVKDMGALSMLAERKPEGDGALMATMEAMVKEGRAVRRFLGGCQTGNFKLESVREHSFPTEMPTIPSAWETQPVGTVLDVSSSRDGAGISLRHHSNRFRMAQFPCALDAPELVTWYPEFFVQSVNTRSHFPPDGVAMVAAVRTPECLIDPEMKIPPGETMMVFAKLNRSMQASEPLKLVKEQAQFHLEAVVFNISAGAEEHWPKGDELTAVDHEAQYQRARSLLKEGKATLACHVAVRTDGMATTSVGHAVETAYVTEYNPMPHGLPRYRPTAVEAEPVGSQWMIAHALPEPSTQEGRQALEVHLAHRLRHDVAPARKPSLKETLAAMGEGDGRLPRAEFHRVEWSGNPRLLPGKAQCLGAMKAPGGLYEDRVFVAFIRAILLE